MEVSRVTDTCVVIDTGNGVKEINFDKHQGPGHENPIVAEASRLHHSGLPATGVVKITIGA